MTTTTAPPIPYDHSQRYELSEVATKRVFRHLLPMLLLMYVIAFLDRANVAFAEQYFEVNYGISAAAFAFGAGLFFVGYALFEVPSNLVMHRVGAKFWMARIMVTWGLIAMGFMFVRSETTFYVLRFLLGIAEAGFFPGMVLYLTYWIPSSERARAATRQIPALSVSVGQMLTVVREQAVSRTRHRSTWPRPRGRRWR